MHHVGETFLKDAEFTTSQKKGSGLWYAELETRLFELASSSEHGLTEEIAMIRLQEHGPNALPAPRRDGPFVVFFRQFESPLIYLLLIAGAIVAAMGQSLDALTIFGVLLFNALVGAFQEGKAQRTLDTLRTFTKTEARVMRGGKELLVSDEMVVPGDVLALGEGDKISADARIFDAHNLKVDESTLTGESLPIVKNDLTLEARPLMIGDQTNMVFKGTFVVSGNAKALVVATGKNTEIGRIGTALAMITEKMPLKEDIKSLSRYITVAVVIISAFIFGAGLL
ncbi:MAG: cation-transporting P-type ATPase, partial [bacterium]|nr:cation-transporting P-type ATPase [bacterium]